MLLDDLKMEGGGLKMFRVGPEMLLDDLKMEGGGAKMLSDGLKIMCGCRPARPGQPRRGLTRGVARLRAWAAPGGRGEMVRVPTERSGM